MMTHSIPHSLWSQTWLALAQPAWRSDDDLAPAGTPAVVIPPSSPRGHGVADRGVATSPGEGRRRRTVLEQALQVTHVEATCDTGACCLDLAALAR